VGRGCLTSLLSSEWQQEDARRETTETPTTIHSADGSKRAAQRHPLTTNAAHELSATGDGRRQPGVGAPVRFSGRAKRKFIHDGLAASTLHAVTARATATMARNTKSATGPGSGGNSGSGSGSGSGNGGGSALVICRNK